MKIYIYRWKEPLPSNICISFLFKKWRNPYRFLNLVFLPQLPSHTNWFQRLFGNREILFSDLEFHEKHTKYCVDRNFMELIKVI